MTPNSASSPDPELDPLTGLRERRAELRDSMSALEQALADPAVADPARWAQRVHVALVELSADLREHTHATEGEDGLHRHILATTPRLAHAVTRLAQDHTRVHALVEELVSTAQQAAGTTDAEVATLRRGGVTLLGLLVAHRQRSADLVFEAFEYDVGGET